MKERISKKRFSHLIQENAIENVIQGLLKEDMSLLSEVYAHPQAEYICFSEFPIGDGFADFVVFTGRSRMEVIVIEIKGADFSFSNSSSYRIAYSTIPSHCLSLYRKKAGQQVPP